MLKDREWPRPTFDQAVSASMQIGSYYARFHFPPEAQAEIEYVSDETAAQRLSDLAEKIMDGEITSHLEVAKVVQGVGLLIGPLGGASTEIDMAAYKVRHAILQKQTSFKEPQV